MNLSRKRKPEVIVFEEPARKQRRKILKKEKEKVKDKNFNAGNMNFKEIAREVRELGVSGFKKKDQRKYKQQRAEELGAKAPKKQKMPYPLLMELKKIQDEKQSKQRELDVAMGVFKKKKKSDEKSKYLRLKGSGRWVDRSQGLEGGKYKNGVQKIKHKDIAKFTKTKT